MRNMHLVLTRFVALSQVMGGSIGIWLLLDASGRPFSRAVSELPFWLFLALYSLTLAGGLGLWSRQRYGTPLSVVMQGAQIVWLSTPKLAFHFGAGAGLTAGVGRQGLFAEPFLGASFKLATSSGFGMMLDRMSWSFGFNLVALACFLYLLLRAGRGGGAA